MKLKHMTAIGLILATVSAKAGVTCRVETDRGTLPAGGRQKAIVKVTLEAPPAPDARERPPVNLALVLDRSGSMSGDKIEHAKEALITAIRRLRADDMVSVVVYDHEVETIVPAQPARNLEWIEARIRSITPRGNTGLFGGVSQGAAEVRKHLEGSYTHRIILLSDGLANVGPSSPEDLGRLGASFLKEQIAVSTIGLGTDYNEDLMTRLSGQSDGNTYFAESSVDLPRIFGRELGDVTRIVARRVTLEIEFPEGVRPMRVIGREGRMNGQRIDFTLNQLYGGQEKYALVEVEVEEGAASAEREVARARCRYEDALEGRESSVEGLARVSFSREARQVEASANVAVQTEWAANKMAEAREEAIKLNDEGRRADAVQRLQSARSSVMSNFSAAPPPAVQSSLQAAAKDEAILQNRALRSDERKAAKTATYEVFNQQRSAN